MIRLFPGHALVVDGSGRSQTLDFDSLRDELAACFAQRGIAETWLAEHVACIVEERVRERHRQMPGILERREIDEMVLAALRSVGFADVAELYASGRGIGTALPQPDGKRSPCSGERLRDLLERTLLLSPRQVEEALPPLTRTVERLGIPLVTDTLLRELALHLLGTSTEEPVEAATSQDIRLLADEHWQTRFAGEAASLLAKGVLRIHPVSAALPRARLDFDLARFGSQLGRPPLLEIQVLATLPATARIIRSVLTEARAEICTRRPSATAHPAQIILRGSAALLAEQLEPLCARAAHTFLTDIRSCLEREISQPSDFDVILSLR
jgi:hypothetical protein